MILLMKLLVFLHQLLLVIDHHPRQHPRLNRKLIMLLDPSHRVLKILIHILIKKRFQCLRTDPTTFGAGLFGSELLGLKGEMSSEAFCALVFSDRVH